MPSALADRCVALDGENMDDDEMEEDDDGYLINEITPQMDVKEGDKFGKSGEYGD